MIFQFNDAYEKKKKKEKVSYKPIRSEIENAYQIATKKEKRISASRFGVFPLEWFSRFCRN